VEKMQNEAKHSPVGETVDTALKIPRSLLMTDFVEVWTAAGVAVVANVTVENDEIERCYWKRWLHYN
jgi:hypothetical protein